MATFLFSCTLATPAAVATWSCSSVGRERSAVATLAQASGQRTHEEQQC